VRQGLGNISLTSVLHTRSRKRKLHPHLHIIVPYGGYNLKRKEWRKVQKGFLFNKSALAKVWRAQVFKAIKKHSDLSLSNIKKMRKKKTLRQIEQREYALAVSMRCSVLALHERPRRKANSTK
jgi:hypothetical protein